MNHKSMLLLSLLLLGDAAQAASRLEYLNSLPLRFEENLGRFAHPGTLYVAQTDDFSLGLTSTGNRLQWREDGKTAVVETKLVDANPAVRLEPGDRVAGTANYFLGAETHWRSDVPGFALILYQSVYPGIDLVFHGEQHRLEYDFVVAPHADPRAIRFELTGQRSLRIDPSGDLVLETDAGEVRWRRPDIYQEQKGARHSIGGGFHIEDGTVTFEVASYNPGLVLVIDPVLRYSTYLGGSGNDGARGIGLDSAGNVYIAGNTTSPNLPTLSALQPVFGGMSANFMNGDAFLAKFSPSGTLLYVTYLGGSGDDAATALAVDSAGNAYVVGATTSSDFPTANPYQARFGGMGGTGFVRSGDAFIAKVNPSGNKLIYSTYLGGSMDDAALAVTIDRQGDAYVAGASASMNFPVTAGVYQSIYRGGGGEPIRQNGFPEWDPGDAFVAKFDPAGQLLLSTYFGGSDDDVAFTIALDSAGNIYLGGATLSVDLPTTPGALQRSFGGTEMQNEFLNTGDGFIVKMNPTATKLLYTTYFGAEGDDWVSSIAVDSAGEVYLTGSTSSMFLKTTPNAFQPVYSGYTLLPFLIEQLYGDAFAAELNAAGSALIYLSYLGGSANDGGMAIAIDTSGNAYVGGFSDSTDFKLAGNPVQSKFAGDGQFGPYLFYGDSFLSVVNPTGTALLYSTYLGGNYDDIAMGIALDGAGTVYLTGATASTVFPNTANAAQPTFGGRGLNGSWVHGDAFYAVLSGFGASGATITKVANAEGESPTITANSWTEVKGTNLSTTTRIWQSADFVDNKLPTMLDDISVTMNGENAFVYYISPTQINVLTPPDLAPGTVQVVVNNSSGSSAAYSAQAASLSLSFFIFGSGPYVVATHLNNTGCATSGLTYCLVGPTSLYPGSSVPAAIGETIVLYTNGFGVVAPPVVSGSLTQSGTLPTKPQVLIANQPATVTFAGLVSPGLYQFNIVVPNGVPSGNDYIVVNYSGSTVALGPVITIQ